MTRTLGMELAGFDPLKFFSPEQVEKMRSMKPEGLSSSHTKSRFGILSEMLVDSQTRNALNVSRKV